MYLEYSNFQFTAGEAWPSFFGQIRTYNQRGRAQSMVRRINVQGEILASGQDAINTRVGQILNALSIEGGSVVFRKDDGSETHIKLPSAGSYGVKIVENSLQMQEAKAHFATALPFSIAFEAEYPISDGDGFVFYQESITKIGNGGPRTVIQELDNGQCVEQQVSTHTPVTMIQQGIGVGAFSYPSFPNPIYGVDNPEVANTYETPETNGTAYINFPIRWSYRKTLPTAPGLVPPNYPL